VDERSSTPGIIGYRPLLLISPAFIKREGDRRLVFYTIRDCPEYIGSVKIVRYLLRLLIEQLTCWLAASLRLIAGLAMPRTLQYAFAGNSNRNDRSCWISNHPMSRTFREYSYGRWLLQPFVAELHRPHCSSFVHRRFFQTVSDFQWMGRIAHDAYHPRLSHWTPPPPWMIDYPREKVRTSRLHSHFLPNHLGTIVPKIVQ
jgi:hypothetical protein